DFRGVDRRRMIRLELDRGEWLETLRFYFELRSSRFTPQLLAARGDRLALVRWRFEGSGSDIGASEIAFLELLEVDDHGGGVGAVICDPDDLDAAYVELDARYAAGEAAAYARTWASLRRFGRAAAARDWEQLASLFAPDYVVEDHRLLGWGTLHSLDEYLTYVHTLVDLSPDARWRLDHVLALDDWRSLAVVSAVGSRDGGPFEIPYVVVAGSGPAGRNRAPPLRPGDRVDAARACSETLASPVPPPRLENAATRYANRMMDAWEAHDWERVAAAFAPGFRLMDRRRMLRIELDRDGWLDNLRYLFDMHSSRFTSQLLAARGDRLALVRVLWQGAHGDAGFRRVGDLVVHEFDDRGDCVVVVGFDPDALDAAYAELDRRYAAGEAVAAARAPESVQRLEPAPATKP